MLIHCTKLKPGKIELEASFIPRSSPSQGIALLKAFSISESSSAKSKNQANIICYNQSIDNMLVIREEWQKVQGFYECYSSIKLLDVRFHLIMSK